MVATGISPRRSLLRFPNELLHQIGSILRDDADGEAGRSALAALTDTCRLFNDIYEPYLYQSDSRHNESYSVVWGASKNHMGTLEKAVRHGADVRQGFVQLPGFDGKGTALHYAALNGFNDIIEFLVDHGAMLLTLRGQDLCDCFNVWDIDGDHPVHGPPDPLRTGSVSPLHLAICHGKINTARLLIDMDPYGWRFNPSAHLVDRRHYMMLASVHGHHCLFDVLLEGVDAERFVQRIDHDGNSLFHAAAGRHGSPETIRALADLGCLRMNVFNLNEQSPLQLAVLTGRWDNATAMLDMGGVTIHRHGYYFDWDREICTALTKYDSRAEIREDDENSSLETVTRWKQEAFSFMSKLIRNFPGAVGPPSTMRLRSKLNRALFNVVDGEWTMRYPAKAVKMLLDLGADPNGKDLDGGTILHYVLYPETEEAVEGDDPHAQLNKEMAHLAHLYKKHRRVIAELLKNGASLEVKDQCGLTPVEYLVKRYDPRRLDPSAPGNPIYRLLVLKVVRLLATFAEPPTVARQTRWGTRAESQNEKTRWTAWAEEEEEDLRMNAYNDVGSD